MSFLIYLLITFLVHLYQNTGRNAAAQAELARNGEESGYAKLDQRGDGPEAYELSERDVDLNTQIGDDDATKIGTEDELDWVDRRDSDRVRL